MTQTFSALFEKDPCEFAPGVKFALRVPALAGDAYTIARAAQSAKKHGQKLLVVTADAADTARLAQEVAWLAPELGIDTLPDWETLPYDVMSPQESLVSERLKTLHRLSLSRAADLTLVSVVTAAQKLPPVSYVGANGFVFKTGDVVSVDALKTTLANAGYAAVREVLAAGEFAVRGGIVDVFPMGSDRPFRLDFMDEEIESIRWFDLESQRSMEPVDSIELLPGHEFPVDAESLTAFQRRWRIRFPGDPTKHLPYRDAGSGVLAPGIEYYLPLFFDETATLADYLSPETRILFSGPCREALDGFLKDTHTRSRLFADDPQRPALSAEELWLKTDEFFSSLKPFARFTLEKTGPTRESALTGCAVDRKSTRPLHALEGFRDTVRAKKGRLLIVAGSPGRQNTMAELFRAMSFPFAEFDSAQAFFSASDTVGLTTGPLTEGFALEADKLFVLTETELYGSTPQAARRAARRASNVEMLVRDITELRVGDPVVHLEHGIGRYRGLERRETSAGEAEFLRIEYKNDAQLLVPIANLHLISRYCGASPETAPLHTLGRGEFDKLKKKAQKQVRDTAAELLHLYALREKRQGFAFKVAAADYDAFVQGFPYDETPDQAAAIEAVVSDMTSGRPMDRLVCGDVGFGKTEVALRAAFVAVMGGKQVAVLCPTTLLAEQHAQTFRDRFAAWPVKVVELSRFRTGKETTKALEDIALGEADIVVGTHKLLGDKVSFADLGLVIIDEEHRFGVRQKEHLKKLRAEVDFLTLTATPIPRTLSMSLDGIRDLSVIATPPERRLAVKTIVQAEEPGLVREAVLRELKRGGQVYFLHNDVATIEQRKSALTELIPEARIEVAHGQMSERELERIMRDFYQQRFNVLLCSTIIETGIDVPSANTIIITRADRFGLAQLHQLRGRVGRSYHQAYAYLLTAPAGASTKAAQQRLDAIQSLEELGSGFSLAMHDLEIRGAGEILGENQSGEISQVGLDLYGRMLERAIRAMKRGETPDFDAPLALSTDINLHAPALIPADYVPDVSVRLGVYKELASARDRLAVENAVEALVDRYGKLPDAAKHLIEVHKLRLRCEALGIRKIDSAPELTQLVFEAKPSLEPLALIALLQARPYVKMSGPEKLRIEKGVPEPEKRIALVHDILDDLSLTEREARARMAAK